jgi:hypothetical protein
MLVVTYMLNKAAESFVSGLLSAAKGPKMPDISVRELFATLAKRHGLTMSCAVLERSVYTPRY